MDRDADDKQEHLDVLLALKSLLEFAKLSADEVAAKALADAIDDASLVAERSIEDLRD